MSTLFISDLHLEDRRPETTAQLSRFLRGPAREAEALYVLGDLFEFWIGDDALTATARDVAAEFSALRQAGVPCWYMHGNRDFLLAGNYAAQAGLTLLDEACVIDLHGTPTLLLHGDTLCTDDTAYQAFRRQVRDPAFQAAFLAKPLAERLQIAQAARDASRAHTGTAAMDIMDVNEQAVIAAFDAHGVHHLIHGHTHRPASHEHVLNDGSVAHRTVLADWNHCGQYLEAGPGGYRFIDWNG